MSLVSELMEASPGWDDERMEDARVVELGEGSAVVSHRFAGERGPDFTYSALMGSVYVRRDGVWRLAFHQQTPL